MSCGCKKCRTKDFDDDDRGHWEREHERKWAQLLRVVKECCVQNGGNGPIPPVDPLIPAGVIPFGASLDILTALTESDVGFSPVALPVSGDPLLLLGFTVPGPEGNSGVLRTLNIRAETTLIILPLTPVIATVWVNGSQTDLSATITASGIPFFSDPETAVAVDAGNLVELRVASGLVGLINFAGSLVISPT